MRCKEFQEAPPLTNTHKRDMLRVEKSATNTSCQMTALHSPSPPTTRLWRRLQRKETTKSIQVTPPTRQQWHNTTWWTMQCWLSWGFCSEDESMCTLPSAVQIVNQQGAHAFICVQSGFLRPFLGNPRWPCRTSTWDSARTPTYTFPFESFWRHHTTLY